MAETVVLERARNAAARYAWREAADAFTDARTTGAPLSPSDLESMADAAWWTGKMRECIALREQAHSGYLEAGDPVAAARMGLRLVEHHIDLGEQSVAAAWLQRAQNLLADRVETDEHALASLMNALMAIQVGDLPTALAATQAGIEIAQRAGSKDMLALGLATNGACRVMGGEVDEGMRRLEEATVAAVSGDLGPLATGLVYCMMIASSSNLADWQRAGQWSEAASRWCERQAISGFPGVCRVHRAEVMKLRGSLSQAEEEARAAVTELGGFNVSFTALAFKELGDIRLRMGDLDAAEEAFRQANEMGVMPLPGLALVQIERGKPNAAFNALRRALAEPMPPVERAKLLPAFTEVALLVGEPGAAREAATEMTGIAAMYASPAMQANAEAATAAVALAGGDLAAAETASKHARKRFQEVDLPFEAARATTLLGQVYAAQGDPDAAEFEFRAALSRFEAIGAVPAATRVRALLDAGSSGASVRRLVRTFFFSDIVKSTDLVGVIGDEAWMDLLSWHDQTLLEAFKSHHGEVISHTGDGFFVAFETAEDAFATAIGIQQALATHRRQHGFAPQVRIGLHATEATQADGNFHGKGVHEAARIGALAGAGEILVSASTHALVADTVTAGDGRQVTLKGVTEPVTVVPVVWS